MLCLIVLISAAKGAYWLTITPVPSADEGANFSYVQSLAEGQGIPTTGVSLVTRGVITLEKNNAVSSWRADTVRPVPSDPGWGLVAQSYEGYQTPLYYLAMVPVYWIGHALAGLLGAFYAVRSASLVLTLLAIPLTYLATRRIFPRRAATALGAAACIGLLQITTAAGAAVGNDSIMPMMGALCLLSSVHLSEGINPRRAAVAGAAVTAAVLSKGSGVAVVPLMVIGFLALAYRQRVKRRDLLRSTGAIAAVAAVGMIPWILYNEAVYGATSGGAAQTPLVVPIVGASPLGLAGVGHLMHTMLYTLFSAESLTGSESTYRWLWGITAVVAVGGGVMVALLRRRWWESGRAIWLAVSYPLGLLVVAVTVVSQDGIGSAVLGRHVDVLVPELCAVIAYGAGACLTPALGSVALAGVITAASFVEVSAMRAVPQQYTVGLVGDLAPVLEQSYTDGARLTSALVVQPNCPASYVSVVLRGAPPAATVAGRPAPIAQINTGAFWTTYALPVVQRTSFVLRFSVPSTIATATASRPIPVQMRPIAVPSLAPAVRIYCPVPHALSYRFEQLYRPQHPFGITYREYLDWPGAVAASTLGGALVALFTGLALGRRDLIDPSEREADPRRFRNVQGSAPSTLRALPGRSRAPQHRQRGRGSKPTSPW